MGKLIEQYSSELRGQAESQPPVLDVKGVTDPLERYQEAMDNKERFEVTFGYASNDGTLYGTDEFGVRLVIAGEQLAKDLSYYSAEHKASFVGTPFVVRVKEIDEENATVYLRTAWSDSKDTRNKLISEIRREIEKEDAQLVVPGRVIQVNEKRALVDILGRGILGIITVDNWQKGYIRYFSKTVQKNGVYDFVVKKELPKKAKTRTPAFILTRKPITEDPWQNIPPMLAVGSVITVKCLDRPQGKTFWWGTSPMVEGIELMCDYTSSVPHPLVGVSYKCKIKKLEPEKHRLQAAPFVLASKDTGTKEAVEFIQSKKSYKK